MHAGGCLSGSSGYLVLVGISTHMVASSHTWGPECSTSAEPILLDPAYATMTSAISQVLLVLYYAAASNILRTIVQREATVESLDSG
jgi:hypothetical protein